MTSIQHTDAMILMELDKALGHVKGQPVTREIQEEIKEKGAPFLMRLRNNGHSFPDAIDLMRRTLYPTE